MSYGATLLTPNYWQNLRLRLRKMQFLLHFSEAFSNFAPSTRRYQHSVVWIMVAGRGLHTRTGIYLTLWFWRSKNSRKVLNQVENKATANALWVCKYPCACLSMYPMYGERQRRYMIYIGVGLQRCSFRLDGQCEKPLERGTSNSTESPRLFCICTVQRVVTEKKQRPHLGETEKP